MPTLRKGDRVVLLVQMHIGAGQYAEPGTTGTVITGGRYAAQVALDGLRDPYFNRAAQIAVPPNGGTLVQIQTSTTR
jgi:hypothetical protein